MRRPVWAAAVGAALLAPALPVAGQGAEDVWSQVARAESALVRGEVREARRGVEQVLRRSPGFPPALQAEARIWVRAGRPARALAALERLADTGAEVDLDADSALAPLARAARFAALRARLGANRAPLAVSSPALRYPDADFIPEGIAAAEVDGAFYLGSLWRGEVARLRRGAPAETLLARAETGGRVLGMRVTPDGRSLWINIRIPAPEGSRDLPGAVLLRVDLASRRVVERFPAPGPGPHLLNDLDIAADGTLYVSDSEAGAVYRLRPGGQALEPWFAGPPNAFSYPNGVALDASGGKLYVAHQEGVSRIDVTSGRAVLLRTGPVFAGWIDGLYRCGGSLVGIQNWGGFSRVVRLGIHGSTATVSVLERRHPEHQIPTTGALVGDTLFYIANSRIDRLGPGETLAPAADAAPPLVLALPVPGGCRDAPAGSGA